MSGIIWLASYPKSGNTWLRIFLSNLLAAGNSPVHINSLYTNLTSYNRYFFDDITGLDSSDLTVAEVDCLRPAVYRFLAANSPEPVFIKCHDAYTYLPGGQPLFPPEVSKAIYIIRNPLDVAVSFSFHLMKSIDKIVRIMGRTDSFLSISAASGATVLHQRLLDWSTNVASWVDAPEMAVHVVRYEDMKAKPLETFTELARFAGLPWDAESIDQAVKFSDFKLLQRQEQQGGFVEVQSSHSAFFREGRSGGWRDSLTPGQIEQVIRDHHRVMRRFGYLDEDGRVSG
ncbi:sulfotransferase domain-containing protein [Sporomusa sp. KB1]|jgi:hypothetical protein|uniref:sulfotransferase domain-containing protein n=1 Tax=Sporomusa sp. KB1 TaxID=943346 RepID=UPI0011AC1259|nr:sulfotransferase domain-containing protein [Sporomusa sp. KB1]TWH45936.1 sulfotransferase domain-containing protein [Sporomusa sp. KB1]